MKSFSVAYGALALIAAGSASANETLERATTEIQVVAQCQATNAMLRRVAATTMTSIVIATRGQSGEASDALAEGFGRMANSSAAKLVELHKIFNEVVLPAAISAGMSEAEARDLWKTTLNQSDAMLLSLFAKATLDPATVVPYMLSLANDAGVCDRFITSKRPTL